jgi:hypothetical protein
MSEGQQGVQQVASAPERGERPHARDAQEAPAARRPRRFGRAIAVLTVVMVSGVGVAVTWPRADPPIASAKADPPAPVDPNAAASPCAPEDLDLTLAADRVSVTPGVPVGFTVSLRNEGDVQCLVDAPRSALAVTVYEGEVGEQGAERAWSSADCADKDEERLLLLGSGDVDTTEVTWSDARSVPGCTPGQPRLAAGEYTAQATLADVEGLSSDVVRLTYTVPEPSGSPSPTGCPSGDSSAGPGKGSSASPSADPSASDDAAGDASDDASDEASKKP